MAVFDNDLTGVYAPDFPKNLLWFNSPPLLLKNLRGKILLIDFWTYSCINCQRTLPHLRNWWQKYKENGLVIIGIHAPEFEFEKNPVNFKKALQKYNVTWPNVLDADYQIWNLYHNHYWPSKYLINSQGKIVYMHAGEGNYLETELQIQKALKEAGYKISPKLTNELALEFKTGQTPELYCGYKRGILGNLGGYKKDQSINYQTPRELDPDMIYLQGVWQAKPEYVEHPRQTNKLEDSLVLSYKAKQVYLVMESASGDPIKVYLTLDEDELNPEDAGADVKFDPDGSAYVLVQFATLYQLIQTKNFGDHIVRISSLERGLRCFAFTFG